MAFLNNMTNLLNEIERRLGTSQLNLPDYLQKDKWAEVIENSSLLMFSRFLPNEMTYHINPMQDRTDGDGYYIIDEDRLGKNIKILGVKDIDFEAFSKTYNYYANGAYNYNTFGDSFSLDTIGYAQMTADHNSLFNNGLYIDYRYPNKVKVSTVANIQILRSISIPIIVLTVHPSNLTTISPTQMTVFEDLCCSDIALWLYNELKYYDQLETVYSNIEMKLDHLASIADRREEIINRLDDGHTSTANAAAPYIITI